MTALRIAELLLWPVAAAAPVALGLALVRPPASVPPLEPPRPLVVEAAPRAPMPADSLAARVVARNVFRLDRKPAPRRYQEELDPEQPALAETPRPALALVGIVAGPEPTAIVEGLPGAEGARVVRVGERIGELLVKRIRGETVEISGMDTVWVLRVREPWNDRP